MPITHITSRKRVPVLAELTGNVAPGFFVREISVVPTTVEIQGQPEDIERISGVSTVPLDIDGARGDIEGDVAFDIPVGVRVLSDQPTAAIVVVVEPLEDTTTIQAAVVAVNLEPNLAVAVSQPSVQVVVGGSVGTLQALRAGDVVAELDLSNLSPRSSPASTHHHRSPGHRNHPGHPAGSDRGATARSKRRSAAPGPGPHRTGRRRRHPNPRGSAHAHAHAHRHTGNRPDDAD